jgi:type IV pilus assembly protein PilV
MTISALHPQRGVFLLEALIAILIFSLGVVGMMAMAGASVTAQSDAEYRSEAANMADQIASQIALKVDRSNLAASLATFSHQPSPAPATPAACLYTGAAVSAADPTVLALVSAAGNSPSGGGLPFATLAQQQIYVETGAGNFNRVTITLCWQSPNDSNHVWRHHTLVSYVN